MTVFQYRAVTRTGEELTGELIAETKAGVSEALLSQELFPTRISRKSGGSLWDVLTRDLSDGPRAYRKDLGSITVQLARLLGAGITVDEALAILIEGDLTQQWVSVFRDIRARVREGQALSGAVREHPDAFPRYYEPLLRAGEQSGTLAEVFARLAEMTSHGDEARDKVLSALVYPCILLVLAVFSVLFVLFGILPQFEGIMLGAWEQLPWSTKMLFGVRHFLSEFWWLAIAIFSVGVVAIWRLSKDVSFAVWRDRKLLAIPYLGDLLVQIDIGKFCRTGGGLLRAGLPVADAFDMATQGLTNRHVRAALDPAMRHIKEGQSPSLAFSETQMLPSQVVQLLKGGEEVGRVPEMLDIGADLLAKQVTLRVDRMLGVLVPGLTILMGVIVGGTVASIFTALLSINEIVL